MENGMNMDIAITDLVRWDKNPRPQTNTQQNADIRASILTKGVLLPLIVRRKKETSKYEVIAGDRRRTEVQDMFDGGLWAADRTVPCIVRTDLDDDADALDVATSENLHLPMHPMNQFIAFSDMIAEGKTIAQIATSYGITQHTVQQRLSYAKLDERARDLVLKDERDLAWASALTIASPSEQAAMLDEIRNDPTRYRNANEVQRRLSSELVPMAYALFDPSEAESSLVRRDIFDVEIPSYLPTADFIRLQDIALKRLVEERKNEGWGAVSVESDRTFDRWKYDDGVEDKARGEVVFVRHQNGEVVEHKGLALRAQARISTSESADDDAAGDALFGDEDSAIDLGGMPASEEGQGYRETKATTAYLERNRALVAQAILMESDPRLTLAVTILGLLSEGAPKPVDGRDFGDMRDIDPESRTRAVIEGRMVRMTNEMKGLGVAPEASYQENLKALMTGSVDQLVRIQKVLVARRIGTSLLGIDRLYDAVTEIGDIPLSSVWSPDRTLLGVMSTEQLKALASDILPRRSATKIKGKKSDMVETMFQHFDDAYQGGMRFDSVERDVIVSWAPEILGGGRPGILSDPFASIDGDALFADEHVTTNENETV